MDRDADRLDGDNPAAPLRGRAQALSAPTTSGVAGAGWLTRLLRRPEAGAVGGLIATIIIFALLPGAPSRSTRCRAR